MSFSSFFSRKNQASSKTVSDIPEEVRQAVTTMGQLEAPHLAVSEKSESETVSSPRSSSPFLDGGSLETSPDVVRTPEAPVTLAPNWSPVAAPELKPLFDSVPQEEKTGLQKKWFIIGGIGIIVLILIGSGAWWLFLRAPEKTVEVPVVEVQVVPQITPEKPQDPPYSLTSPNYLSVDTETITPASFREVWKQPAERIHQANMSAPVEFLLTDKNNNPLAFSRFAYLMNLDIKPELLASIGESFSFFLYDDQGRVAPGLGLMFAGDAGRGYLTKDGFLPFAFRNILFDTLSVPKDVVFRSGVYNAQAVRFVNIDAAANISFDYALRENYWFIGTSKNTLRAILDKKQ